MASWGGLPIEILYCIFNQLDEPSDLSKCLFTCKNWHKATQGLIYNSVKLYSQKQVISFANCMNISQNEDGPSLMVKKISVFNNSTLDNLQLSDILKSCHNIKTINTVDFSPGNPFFATIMHERNQGRCLLLESIPFPLTIDEDTRIYGQTAWNLRDRLVRLMISDRADRYDSLKGFPRLKYLLYNVNTEGIYDIDSIIRSSCSLQSVEINQHTRITDSIGDDFSKTPCHHIKEFIGSGIILPTRRMLNYLMFIFPNLNYLNIFFALNTLKSQLSVDNFLATDITVEFLLHVYKKISTFNLEQLYVLSIVDVANGFLEASNFNGTLEIRYENDYNHPQHVSLTRKKFIVKCVQSLQTPYSILPHREFIRRFGSNLAGVILDFGDAYALYQGEEGQVNKNDVHGYCMDYVFKHCPNIQSLELGNFLFSHCDADELVVCHTLQVLVFDCCEFSNTALEEISKRIPNLSLLSILDSDFEYDSIWEMLIYDTCVNTIHWKDTGHENSQDDYLEFHLCLEMGGEPLFYSGNKFEVNQCLDNGNAYHNTFDIDDKLTIKIACKCIKFFNLDIPNIKMLIKYPGQTKQEIFVHPSQQYYVETAKIMRRKL